MKLSALGRNGILTLEKRKLWEFEKMG